MKDKEAKSEISNEVKAKVFAQYLGQPFKMIINDRTFRVGVCTLGTIQLLNPEDILILKPLSAITDEHAIEVAEMFYGLSNKNKYIKNYEVFNVEHENTIKVTAGNKEGNSIGGTVSFDYKSSYIEWDENEWKQETDFYSTALLNAYQYLQSVGYDLPTFYLGGKTLFESELCV